MLALLLKLGDTLKLLLDFEASPAMVFWFGVTLTWLLEVV